MATPPDFRDSIPEGVWSPDVLASRAPQSWVRYVVIAAFIGLVLAPLLVWGTRGELGRWHEAAFFNAKYAGDLPVALEQLDQAIHHLPDRYDLLIERSELLMRTGDYDGALADADVLVDWTRQQQQMKPGDTLLRQQLAYQLNMRAYYRAVADRKNTEGLADIQEAFELLGNDLDPSMRDTRGYLYYRLGNYESAIADLDFALPQSKRLIMARLAELQGIARSGTALTADQQWLAYQQRSLREGLGVIHQHRGLVLEQLNRMKAARRDFALARQYGYDDQKGSL